MVELDDGTHGDGGGRFINQDTIEDVIGFRIDSHTMKREKSWLKRLSSATR